MTSSLSASSPPTSSSSPTSQHAGSLWIRGSALAASWGIRAWMRTLDFRGIYADPVVDPALCAASPRIYVFWHEFILIPLYLRGHCDLTMLLSRHRDADILSALAHQMGFECIRGSTYNGASTALRELTRCGQHRHLAITPDGPRGPRRQLAQGPIYLASRMQIPIVALGFGVDRPWRANSWDRFAVPRPWSRVRVMVSEEMFIEADRSREEIEYHRLRVEQRLNDLTSEAESWATTGERRPEEVIGRRQGRAPVAEVEQRVRSHAGKTQRPRPEAVG